MNNELSPNLEILDKAIITKSRELDGMNFTNKGENRNYLFNEPKQ